MLAIILVLGSRASRSAHCAGSAQAQQGRILFFSDASSEWAKFFCRWPRSTYRFYRRSLGFQGYWVARNLAQGTAPIFQDKSGSFNPIGTIGFQSAYRRSGFRESRRCLFIAVEVVDRRNTESTFGAEPTVLAPGHIKRACKGGQPLL
jgi:hypothetical protein